MPPTGLVVDGDVTLRELATSQTDAGDDWSPVPLDPAANGWSWTRIGPEGMTVYRPPVDAPGRIEIGQGDDDVAGAARIVRPSPVRHSGWRSAPTGDGIVPVIAGDRLLALTGAHPGDTIRVSSAGQDLTVRIVGSSASFPPLDPSEPFLIADGATLDLVRFAADGYPGGRDRVAPGRRRRTSRRGRRRSGHPAVLDFQGDHPDRARPRPCRRSDLARDRRCPGARGAGGDRLRGDRVHRGRDGVDERAARRARAPPCPRAIRSAAVGLADPRAGLPARRSASSVVRSSACSSPGSCCPTRPST